MQTVKHNNKRNIIIQLESHNEIVCQHSHQLAN